MERSKFTFDFILTIGTIEWISLKFQTLNYIFFRPYKCKSCEKSFRQWGDLKYHETSIHSNKKDHICEFVSFHCIDLNQNILIVLIFSVQKRLLGNIPWSFIVGFILAKGITNVQIVIKVSVLLHIYW